MNTDPWEVLDEVGFGIPAEVILGLLESQGIHALLSQEGAGKAYGLTLGALGRVQILVKTSEKEKARQVLDAFYNGEYSDMDFKEDEEENEEDEGES
jgi:hypothetical protein